MLTELGWIRKFGFNNCNVSDLGPVWINNLFCSL